MNSKSERRLSTEELKRLNQPQEMKSSKASLPPMVLLPAADWNMLLNRLERLEASVGAQEALLRAMSRQVGQRPTQEQTEALARDVAQMRAELKQAGKKKEFSISPPSLRSALSISIWLVLILLATMVGMVVLQTVWSGLAALWSVVQMLIPRGTLPRSTSTPTASSGRRSGRRKLPSVTKRMTTRTKSI